MEIVVLDGYTLNPGDLRWDALRALGECTIYDRTPAALTVERARRAEIVLTNKVVLNRGVLAQLPELRYIGVLATGINIVDLAAAGERGLVVTNVPAYSTRSVAQLVMALLLEFTHHVGHHAHGVRTGKWSASADFSYADYPLIELDGLTMGIVGLGRIGRTVAALAQAFGMSVLAYHHRPTTPPLGVELVELETLFRCSDVVSLHCPLTPQTTGLVNANRLASMKPSAFLINTGRGPLVHEQELADALNAGRLAGAGLDVLSSEPPRADNPLLSAKNCSHHPAYRLGHPRRAHPPARRRRRKHQRLPGGSTGESGNIEIAALLTGIAGVPVVWCTGNPEGFPSSHTIWYTGRMMDETKQVIVVGAGASGLMAAGVAAGRGRRVLLLERNEEVGRKLLISGKGRCNLANDTDIEELLANIPGNPKFLRTAFYRFGPHETIDFFTARGVPLKTERGGRVFPVSDNAEEVVRALTNFSGKAGCKFARKPRCGAC